MGNWLKTLIGGAGRTRQARSGSLEQERELQSLRLELAQREQEIAGLQREISRIRDRSDELARTTSQAQLEQLLTDLSKPIGVLLALTADRGGSTEDDAAQLKNVVNVLRQVPRILQDYGWQPVGQVGEMVSYDHALHDPLAQDESPEAGQQVTVRWPGGSYAGRVLLRAGVTLNRKTGQQAGR